MKLRLTDSGSGLSRGFTMVETLTATVLLAVILLGTVQYFFASRNQIEHAARSQWARGLMQNQYERCFSLGFRALADSLPETSTLFSRGALVGYRTTQVFLIDDSLDGLSPTDITTPDYAQVQVTFAWFQPSLISDSIEFVYSPQRDWGWDWQ